MVVNNNEELELIEESLEESVLGWLFAKCWCSFSIDGNRVERSISSLKDSHNCHGELFADFASHGGLVLKKNYSSKMTSVIESMRYIQDNSAMVASVTGDSKKYWFSFQPDKIVCHEFANSSKISGVLAALDKCLAECEGRSLIPSISW